MGFTLAGIKNRKNDRAAHRSSKGECPEEAAGAPLADVFEWRS